MKNEMSWKQKIHKQRQKLESKEATERKGGKSV